MGDLCFRGKYLLLKVMILTLKCPSHSFQYQKWLFLTLKIWMLSKMRDFDIENQDVTKVSLQTFDTFLNS